MIPEDGDAAVVVHPGVSAFDFPAALILTGGKAAGRMSLLALTDFPDACRNNGTNGTGASRRKHDGPDYTHWHGMYEVSKHFYTKFLPEVVQAAAEKSPAMKEKYERIVAKS